MHILCLGGVVGKTGRIAIQKHLPKMIEDMTRGRGPCKGKLIPNACL